CPLLLFSGGSSIHAVSTRTLYDSINKSQKKELGSSRVELIEMSGVVSPTIERFESSAKSILYFLQGIGVGELSYHFACQSYRPN
ncbi:hypothetical protein Ciccas_002407, partial [Cichlidogyrus casuarinus]